MSSTAPALGEGAQIPFRAHMPSPSSFSPTLGWAQRCRGRPRVLRVVLRVGSPTRTDGACLSLTGLSTQAKFLSGQRVLSSSSQPAQR